MVHMFNAALICDPCAAKVRDDFKTAEGWLYGPATVEGGEEWRKIKGWDRFNAAGDLLNPAGQSIGTDTDTFPADCTGLSSDSDTVEFCDFGADCLGAFVPPYIPGGPKPWAIGEWLENDLTRDALASLRDSIKTAPRNPVVAFSRAMYRDFLEG